MPVVVVAYCSVKSMRNDLQHQPLLLFALGKQIEIIRSSLGAPSSSFPTKGSIRTNGSMFSIVCGVFIATQKEPTSFFPTMHLPTAIKPKISTEHVAQSELEIGPRRFPRHAAVGHVLFENPDIFRGTHSRWRLEVCWIKEFVRAP